MIGDHRVAYRKQQIEELCQPTLRIFLDPSESPLFLFAAAPQMV